MSKEAAYTASVDRLIAELNRLPGIGRRSAERIAFHLVRAPSDQSEALASAIREMKRSTLHWSRCFNLTERDPCAICGDARRDAGLIMVVEQPSDVMSLESTGMFRGVYHVLMGRLAPLDNIGPGDLNIAALLERVKADGVREVILGTNPTLEGDGTALYLAEQLGRCGVRVTRLARGIPAGSSLETVSKAVLADAISGRHGMEQTS